MQRAAGCLWQSSLHTLLLLLLCARGLCHLMTLCFTWSRLCLRSRWLHLLMQQEGLWLRNLQRPLLQRWFLCRWKLQHLHVQLATHPPFPYSFSSLHVALLSLCCCRCCWGWRLLVALSL